jgi:L-fucose mutarotase
VLKYRLIHPEILGTLAQAGHGAKVLLADGNYPFSVMAPAGAKRVYLNLCPGTVQIVPLLKLLVEAIPVESALVMLPTTGEPLALHGEYRDILGPGVEMHEKPRFDFYQAACAPETCLVIATGEQRRFANILLTIGVVKDVRP